MLECQRGTLDKGLSIAWRVSAWIQSSLRSWAAPPPHGVPVALWTPRSMFLLIGDVDILSISATSVNSLGGCAFISRLCPPTSAFPRIWSTLNWFFCYEYFIPKNHNWDQFFLIFMKIHDICQPSLGPLSFVLSVLLLWILSCSWVASGTPGLLPSMNGPFPTSFLPQRLDRNAHVCLFFLLFVCLFLSEK